MNLNQITIPSLDLTKSIPFYKKLELQLIAHKTTYALFLCQNGATFLIHQVEKLPKGNGVWIYFEINNLDQKVNELIKNDFAFNELPNDKSWLWCKARLTNLDKNQLILYFAGKNRINPPWKIKH